MTWLIALQAAAVAPVCIAFMDTSMRKKYTAGMGSRTWNQKNHSLKWCHSEMTRKQDTAFTKQETTLGHANLQLLLRQSTENSGKKTSLQSIIE